MPNTSKNHAASWVDMNFMYSKPKGCELKDGGDFMGGNLLYLPALVPVVWTA